MHVTSQPSPASFFAMDEPTRPHPTITAFTAPPYLSLLQDAVGEGNDEDLARGVLEDVVDRRREEP